MTTGIEIATLIGSPALAHEVASELERAGHRVSTWKVDAPLDDTVRLLIVEGFDDAIGAINVPCDLVLLIEPSELTLFPEFPRELSDFVLKPLRPGEIGRRVANIASLPPRPVRERDRILALAVAATSDIVEVTTPDSEFEFVNRAYERVLGYTCDEVLGKTSAQLVRSNAHPPEFFAQVDRTLERGQTWRGTLISKARDGRLVQLDTTLSPVADRKGQISHVVGIKRDITEEISRREALEEANRALSLARDAAVSASRAKSEFLANMSHELRTPLNAIIGYAEMLMEDLAETEQTYADLKRIRSAGAHLLTLINDVLDISKIEADRVDLVPHPFPVAELVEELSASVAPLARTNANEFRVNAANLGVINADRMRLRQIMLNLLSNAFKFTRSGTITLDVQRIERDNRPMLELAVRDTGIGISEEQRQRLFRPFVQADASTTREYGGTGLGLAISKRLAELMGGSIELESTPGQGSVFTLRIPTTSDDNDEVLQAARRDNQPLVLLIDDHRETIDLFRRQLTKRGFAVICAETGGQGVELAISTRPAVIVLDVKMPGMSGWEVLSRLKLDATTAAIPVIMMTVMHQKEIGQTLGAADYLIKPIDATTLTDVLRRHTKMPSAKVLVVEDDEPTRTLIRRTLENRGNVVDEADNGKVALERIEIERPDIVVLDLMMPVMDGFGFLHALRADPRYAQLPVIVATARELGDAERRELAETAQQLIEKSAHTRQELIAVIGDQIEQLVAAQDSAGTE